MDCFMVSGMGDREVLGGVVNHVPAEVVIFGDTGLILARAGSCYYRLEK
jgi:hypothetical protein